MENKYHSVPFGSNSTISRTVTLSDIKNNPELSEVLADTIIQNTGGKSDGVFWDSAEQSLLQAVVLFMAIGDVSGDIVGVEYHDKMEIGDVYKYITETPLSEIHKHFDTLASVYPEHPALLPYKS
ncbi:MAG: hypothetical protein ACI4HK_05930, partial [Ruminococcus sp.]